MYVNFTTVKGPTNALQIRQLMPMLESSFIMSWTNNGKSSILVLLDHIMRSLTSRFQFPK